MEHQVSNVSEPQYLIFLVAIFCIISVPIRMLIRRFNCPFPQNFFLVTIGIVLGIVFMQLGFLSEDFVTMTRISPYAMLSVYLPIYIVSTIYRMDYYIFVRCLPQVMLISWCGVILNAAALGVVLKDILHSDWNYIVGVLAALCAIPLQPSNVITMLKELAKYKYLGTMLEGESIICLIPVLLAFEIFMGLNDEYFSQWYHFVILLVRYVSGGVVVGVILGKMQTILLIWLYNDPLSALCVSIGMTFFTYFLCEFMLAVSGVLATVCLVCFIAVEKHRFTSEVDNGIACFWGNLHYIAEIATLMTCTVEITKYLIKYTEILNMYGTVIMYFGCNIIRIMCFFIMGLLLNRLTYEVNIKCLIVLGWCGIKGNLNMLLILTLLANPTTNAAVRSYLLEIFIYIYLSLLINNTSMRLVLELIGLSELSAIRRTNMNNCLRFIMEKRVCVINMLKLNRYLADANWALVRTETIMKHPYKLKVLEEEEEEEDYTWNSNSAVCPDCFKEVPFDISEAEFAELLREAQIKVLKAKKVSIIKQYENGIINKNCLQVLVHNIEIMIESNPKNNTIELERYLRENRCLKVLTKLVIILTRTPEVYPPNRNCEKCCFYLIMHDTYDYILYMVIIVNAAFVIWNHHRVLLHHMFYYYLCWWFFYLAEFIVKIIGLSYRGIKYGIANYFTSWWNVFDFILLLWLFADLAYITPPSKTIFNWFLFVAIPAPRFLTVLRLIKIVELMRVLASRMLRTINHWVDTRICFGFDLATALANCCDEVLESFSQIIDMRMIRDIFYKDILTEKQSLIKMMENVQKERPWIAITVKTKQAIRTTLTAMEEALNELRVSGFVDLIEYNFIYKEIFEKQKFLRNMKFVQPSPPKVIFNEVSWMAEDEKIIEYLYNHVETVKWDGGEVVIKEGRHTKGVYIIVTGLLRLKYHPKDATIGRLQNYGKIPIIDYLSTLKFDKKMEDNIMSGNSIGELSFLTGRTYDCAVYAESPSQAYLLTNDVIKEAMELNSNPVNGLESRMWKYCTINLAVAIMMNIPLYQSYTQEQIKFKLEKAFMPNLTCYKMFVITEMMDDVLLIEGAASDFNTGEMFMAPMLIPRTIQKLILPKSSYMQLEEKVDTRLLIIPMGDAREFDIMEHEEEIAELVSIPSSRCLLHAVHDQQRRKKKLGAIKRKGVDKGLILTKESVMSYPQETNSKHISLLEGHSTTRLRFDSMSDGGGDEENDANDRTQNYFTHNRIIGLVDGDEEDGNNNDNELHSITILAGEQRRGEEKSNMQLP